METLNLEKEVIIPEPKPVSPITSKEEFLEYHRLAEKLGIKNPPEQREHLYHVLTEENITGYQRDSVCRWLDDKLGNEWVWAGVRQSDVERYKGWTYHAASRDVKFSVTIYSGAIPYPVLLTMEKIIDKLPEAHFYISSPKEPVGDPFLMVEHGNRCVIIERWDEPGFRDTK